MRLCFVTDSGVIVKLKQEYFGFLPCRDNFRLAGVKVDLSIDVALTTRWSCCNTTASLASRAVSSSQVRDVVQI